MGRVRRCRGARRRGEVRTSTGIGAHPARACLISCFGFSRGAYTARAVAGLLTQIGVIHPSRMDFFPSLYQQYKANTGGTPFRETDAFKKCLEHPVLRYTGAFLSEAPIVKVVGTFDTVGALGIPDIGPFSMAWFRKDHGFHNTGLDHCACTCPHGTTAARGARRARVPGTRCGSRRADGAPCTAIHNAFQALALDEHRGPFQPTLWHLPSGKKTTRLEQCWFPGVHINIGGGSDDQIKGGRGDREQIATITLAWMIDRCRPFLGFDELALQNIWAQHAVLTSDPSFAGFADTMDPHAEARPKLTSGSPAQAAPKRTWGQSFKAAMDYAGSFVGYGPPAPDTHKIGYASGRIVDSFTYDYKPFGDGTRTPGVYKPQLLAKDGEKTTSRTATASTVELTRETIHPSVWARMQAAPPPGEARYQPPALAGFTRERVGPAAAGETGYVWVDAKRNIRIPEHAISCPLEKGGMGEVDAHCLERKLIKGLLPDLVKELDEANGVHDPNPYVPGQPYDSHKHDCTTPLRQASVQYGFPPPTST
jgi:hypothetical protein